MLYALRTLVHKQKIGTIQGRRNSGSYRSDTAILHVYPKIQAILREQVRSKASFLPT
jgi:hypothetical protein